MNKDYLRACVGFHRVDTLQYLLQIALVALYTWILFLDLSRKCTLWFAVC
jgi:hypothetical protein